MAMNTAVSGPLEHETVARPDLGHTSRTSVLRKNPHMPGLVRALESPDKFKKGVLPLHRYPWG